MTGSKKTLTPITLTPEQKRHLRKLGKRKPIDYDQVIGGKRRRGWVWRPGNFLFAFHRMFTWIPRGHWERGWRSIWWLWFEASYAEAPHGHSRQRSPLPKRPAQAQADGGTNECG